MKLSNPKISIVMGSQSDWSTLKHTSTVLKELKISHEKKNSFCTPNSKKVI